MIKLKDITKYYYGDTSVTLALKSINLEFKKGEFVAITGKSGSGKSTLINLISGMDSYEEGELYFKGMETSYYDENDWELYRKNNISFVYQSYNLIDSYTALQNVEAVMMICENDENKMTKKQRRQKAMEVLRKVGLEKQAGHKASHMSSGQKQRLGIARALAKDTDVIVADEPTGNLDVENGKAVMKIFHELAEENKLVLVVTHNYEQAEPFVTRKIRLFDGEVVEDLKLDRELYEDKDFQSDYGEEAVEDKEAEKTFAVARQFVAMNRMAQPHRSLFIFLFLLISALATVIFLGYFISNLDDTTTRVISDEAFNNVSNDRLIVKRLDGEVLTEKDYSTISKISRVEYVEKYDYANDFYYFYQEGEDYRKDYKVGVTTKKIVIEKLKYQHFVKSSSGISEKELRKGRLPESIHEIVIYTDDDSMLGETMEIFMSGKDWKGSEYIGAEFKIVGILTSDREQIYFSEELLETLDNSSEEVNIENLYKLQERSVYGEGVEDVVEEKDRYGDCRIVIGEGLTGNQARVSSDIIYSLYPEGKENNGIIQYRTLMDNGKIMASAGDGAETEYDIIYLQEGSLCSVDIVEVSKELYFQIKGENNMYQASVFIEDYAYTDDVLRDLSDNGYDAISVLRASAAEYDSALVSERLMMLMVSLIVIAVIFVLDILVIYLLMKLKRGDFVICKSLGMKQKTVNQMNYYELVTLTLAADIVAIIAGYICCEMEVPLIRDIMKYYRISHYMIVIVINVAMAAVTAAFFNRYLGKRFRLTSLKSN